MRYRLVRRNIYRVTQKAKTDHQENRYVAYIVHTCIYRERQQDWKLSKEARQKEEVCLRYTTIYDALIRCICLRRTKQEACGSLADEGGAERGAEEHRIRGACRGAYRGAEEQSEEHADELRSSCLEMTNLYKYASS